jgi:outer membrane lipoprotein SlyB
VVGEVVGGLEVSVVDVGDGNAVGVVVGCAEGRVVGEVEPSIAAGAFVGDAEGTVIGFVDGPAVGKVAGELEVTVVGGAVEGRQLGCDEDWPLGCAGGRVGTS